MKKFALIFPLLFLLFILIENDFAQTVYTPYVYSTPVYQRIYDQTYLTNMAVNQMMRSNIARADMNALLNPANRAATLAKWNKLYAQTSGPTQYKPSKGIILTDEEILKMFDGDKEKAEEFDKAGNEALDAYMLKILSNGAPSNDVASGLGFTTTIYYKIANNYLKENSNRYEVGNLLNIINQLRAAMIAEGKIVKLKAFDKERMLVMNIATAALIHKKYKDAVNQGDARAIKDAQMLSRKIIEDLVGAPFDKIIITEKDGISLKK